MDKKNNAKTLFPNSMDAMLLNRYVSMNNAKRIPEVKSASDWDSPAQGVRVPR